MDDDLARVAAGTIGDDADAAGLNHAEAVFRTPEADIVGTASVHDDNMARLDFAAHVRGRIAHLIEPNAMGVDDVFGCIELPHRLVGRHGAHRIGNAPELHANPDRADVLADKPDIEIADTVHAVGNVGNAQVLEVFADFERIDGVAGFSRCCGH